VHPYRLAELFLQEADCRYVVRVFHGYEHHAVFVDVKGDGAVLLGDALRDHFQDVLVQFLGNKLDERHVNFGGVQLGKLLFTERVRSHYNILQGLFVVFLLFTESLELFIAELTGARE